MRWTVLSMFVADQIGCVVRFSNAALTSTTGFFDFRFDFRRILSAILSTAFHGKSAGDASAAA